MKGHFWAGVTVFGGVAAIAVALGPWAVVGLLAIVAVCYWRRKP